jgi:hypothetical protein
MDSPPRPFDKMLSRNLAADRSCPVHWPNQIRLIDLDQSVFPQELRLTMCDKSPSAAQGGIHSQL